MEAAILRKKIEDIQIEIRLAHAKGDDASVLKLSREKTVVQRELEWVMARFEGHRKVESELLKDAEIKEMTRAARVIEKEWKSDGYQLRLAAWYHSRLSAHHAVCCRNLLDNALEADAGEWKPMKSAKLATEKQAKAKKRK